MELIDTHCHLSSLKPDSVPDVIQRAFDLGVKRLLCIGSSEKQVSARQAVSLAEQFPNVWASIGVHPHDAGEFSDLSALEKLVSCRKVKAVGETGLDYYRNLAPRDRQQTLFRNSIAFAKAHELPLIIHCREAQEDTLRILQEEKVEAIGGVFHCYAGDAALAAELRRMNFFVSFAGNITFKKALGLQEAVKLIPMEQILLETDTPYLAPEPFRGKESEPAHVLQTAQKIAELKEISLDQVAQVTTANAETLFGLQ